MKSLKNRSFLAFLALFFLTSSNAYAAIGKCDFSSGPTKELSSYMTKTDTLLSKLAEEASKYECSEDKSGRNSATATTKQTASVFVGSMNDVLDFSNFTTSGRFYIDIVIKSEIPPGINRDHDQLEQTINRMRDVYRNVYGRCAGSRVISSELSEDASYTTKGKTIGDVLDDLLKNQTDMLNFYRETVLGDSTDSYSFILVGDNTTFKEAMKKSYGPKGFEACVQEWSAFKKVSDAIEKITSLSFNIWDAMNDWEAAYKLLNSNSSSPQYAEVERDVLLKELSRQGMSGKASAVILRNLARFNSENKHEGISGFVGEIGERVYSSVNQFGDAFQELSDSLKQSKTTDEYARNYQNIRAVKNDIFDELKADYITAKDLMWPEVQAADTNVDNLIQTHVILVKSNAELRPYIRLSEKTCNDQGQGQGNCRYDR